MKLGTAPSAIISALCIIAAIAAFALSATAAAGAPEHAQAAPTYEIDVVVAADDFDPRLRIAPIVWDMVHIRLGDRASGVALYAAVTKPMPFGDFDAAQTHPAVVWLYCGAHGCDTDVVGIIRSLADAGKITPVFVVMIHCNAHDLPGGASGSAHSALAERLLTFVGDELFSVDWGASRFYACAQIPNIRRNVPTDFALTANPARNCYNATELCAAQNRTMLRRLKKCCLQPQMIFPAKSWKSWVSCKALS